LEKEDWEPMDKALFSQQVYSLYELWGPRHKPVSLRRMIDDGKLDLIESKDLQQAILQYESAYLEAIEQTRTSYSYSLELTPKITSSLKFSERTIVNTAEELATNQILQSAVRDKAIWQRIQLDVLNELQVERTRLLNILDSKM